MPLSGADMRLVDVVRLGERLLRVRAGKIDAVLARREDRGDAVIGIAGARSTIAREFCKLLPSSVEPVCDRLLELPPGSTAI
jgi:hypothetical protein